MRFPMEYYDLAWIGRGSGSTSFSWWSMWPLFFPAPFRLLYQASSQKKKLSSCWRTPYLVTKLMITSEHFSANPNQSYLTPMTTFHHPKGMQLFNVVHISSKDWRKRVTHCAQDGRWWQMALSKALRTAASWRSWCGWRWSRMHLFIDPDEVRTCLYMSG